MIQKFIRKAEDAMESDTDDAVETPATCLPRSLFVRSLNMPSDSMEKKRWRFRKAALYAVQAHAEAYVGQLFQKSKVIAASEGRVTVQACDFRTALG